MPGSSSITGTASVSPRLAEERLVAETIAERTALFLAPLQRAERGIAGHLCRLAQDPPPWGPIDAEKALPWVETRTGQVLSASHRTAIATVLDAKVAIITGGPGVGKTTVVNSLL
jgi:exodeoxyribonuclease V alpha subunit